MMKIIVQVDEADAGPVIADFARRGIPFHVEVDEVVDGRSRKKPAGKAGDPLSPYYFSLQNHGPMSLRDLAKDVGTTPGRTRAALYRLWKQKRVKSSGKGRATKWSAR